MKLDELLRKIAKSLPLTAKGAIIWKADRFRIRQDRPRGAAPEAWGAIEDRLKLEAAYYAHAANVMPSTVEALRQAVEILEKEFDYRPDDEAGSGWDDIKAAIAVAENVKDTP